ncbi:MAG: B12-binding domain-containing radical SAM protein [Candidatus Hermodarchaeota archaeon]
MRNNDIDLLMIFPSGGSFQEAKFTYNLGAGYITAYLGQKGFKVEQFLSDKSFSTVKAAELILNLNPRIIGFTVYNSNYMQCVLLSRELKKISSEIIIIFGGPTPSIQAEDIMKVEFSVDICVRGEGEEILEEILTFLTERNFKLTKESMKSIHGITIRENKFIVSTPDSNILIKNRAIKNFLDKYPSPYLAGIIPPSIAYSTGIITARGCNQNCVYCNCSVLSKKNIFFHSVKRVIEELTLLSKYKNTEIIVPIYDDAFTIIPSRAKKICNLIIENDINIKLGCVTRCDKLDRNLLDLMKKAGFEYLGLSLESAVPRVLRAIGKVNDPNHPDTTYKKEKQFIRRLKTITSYAKRIGFISVFVSIMVGLPNETNTDIKKTIKYIEKLDIDLYQHNYFKIYAGTPIHDIYEGYGYKLTPISQKNPIFTNIDYPFDVYKTKIRKKSLIEEASKIVDYNTLKLLSFNVSRNTKETYFRNVIIKRYNLDKQIIKWLQENLMINGKIIQIYPDKNKFLKQHYNNSNLLFGELSPTIYYEAYYFEPKESSTLLIPGRTYKYGFHTGFPIQFIHNFNFSEREKNESIGYHNAISMEETENDSRNLHNLLHDIFLNDNEIGFLLHRKILPIAQNLCKWMKERTNCNYLESAIIDQDHNVRVCWFGEPIGTIDDSFDAIKAKINYMKEQIIEERKCIECPQNNICIKCINPYPLTEDEYCEIRRKFDTSKPASLLNMYYVLKDLLLNPIHPTFY